MKEIKINIRKAFAISILMCFLTFPIVVIKVNTIEKTINFRWINLIYITISTFIVSLFWDYLLEKRKKPKKEKKFYSSIKKKINIKINKNYLTLIKLFLIVLLIFLPYITRLYLLNVISTALIYIILALGLNIVVGLGGLLNLGYIAFYAVGAYTYALLNRHFGINFWFALPIAGLLSMLFGLVIGFPVLRLRGDYLAIVTLAFGEITRIILENWNEFSFGPSGISKIPKPPLFNLKFTIHQHAIFIYYILLALVIITIIVVNRLENSRIGRRWVAMREDEIACQSVGINLRTTKLLSFALGALWAGFAGVVFAAKTTFINPASFTIWESIIILCIVVLGGMGSVIGVIIATFVLVVIPEFLRFFSEYRMFVFGALLVVMMIFKPEGIVKGKRKIYLYR